MNTCQAARSLVSSALGPCPLVIAVAWSLAGTAILAAADGDASNTTTWAIAAEWLDDDTIVATTTSGLHYQPSQLIMADVNAPQKMTVIGRGKASMWSALPIGDRILTTNYEGAVQTFDRKSSDPENLEPASIEAEARWIRASVMLPSGDVLLGTQDGKVLVLDAEKASISRSAELHQSAIFDIAINDDGTQFATATETGEVGLFSVDDIEEIAKWSASSQSVWAVAFAGDRLVTAGADRRINVWETQTQQLVVAITATDDWGSSIATIPGTSLLIVGSLSGSVTLVDTSTLFSVSTEKIAKSGIWSLSVSPSGNNLLAATRKHGIQIIDISTWPETAQAAKSKSAATLPPMPE